MKEQRSEVRDTVRVQLNYPVTVVQQPVVCRLVTDFGLIPNIRRASIDYQVGGYLFLELSGRPENITQALAWLQELGIGIDAIGLDGQEEWAL